MNRSVETTNPHLYEDELDLGEDWPYCECGNDADEEEDAFNVCKSCGKPLS
jgi:hypothetical protein